MFFYANEVCTRCHSYKFISPVENGEGPVTVFVEDDLPSLDFSSMSIRIDPERQHPTISRSLEFAVSSHTSTDGFDAETPKSNYEELWKRLRLAEGHLREPVQVSHDNFHSFSAEKRHTLTMY